MVDNELVLAIQNGDKSKIPELWNSVKKWTKKVAYSFYEKFKDYCDAQQFDADDLAQCGYFALLRALETYSADKGGFISWYTYYLTRQFRKEIHVLSDCPNNQAKFNLKVDSLNVPINDDNDPAELLELIPDTRNDFAEIEDKDEQESLHKMLDDFMSDVLSELDKTIICKKYWEGKTEKQIADDVNMNYKLIYNHETRGLRKLKANALFDAHGNHISKRRLLNYLEQTDYYIKINQGLLRSEHTSIPEQIVLRKESYGML